MCVQNVNATISLFSDVKNIENQGSQEFIRPFDVIRATTSDDGSTYIGDFYIVVDITLLSTTADERKATNVIINKQNLNVLLRLTKSTEDTDKRLSLDLDHFCIDASDENIVKKNACVHYINYKRIKKIDVKAIKLNSIAGFGDYILKVLVKRPVDSDWQVQSIYNLRIE